MQAVVAGAAVNAIIGDAAAAHRRDWVRIVNWNVKIYLEMETLSFIRIDSKTEKEPCSMSCKLFEHPTFLPTRG